MSRHTPGPWRAIGGYRVYSALGADSGDGAEADINDGWCICICSGDEVPQTSWGGTEVPLGWGPVKANARLIAAAPELLAALKDVIGWVPSASCFATLEPMRAVDRARAAIAKAEGRE